MYAIYKQTFKQLDKAYIHVYKGVKFILHQVKTYIVAKQCMYFI